MADIDNIIAGVGGNTRYDFSTFGDPVKSYWDAKDQRAKNDLRDAFKGGVPLNADGSLDVGSVMKTLLQKGDIAGGVGLAGASSNAADRSLYANGGQPQQPIVGPSTSRNSVTIDPSKRAQSPQSSQSSQSPQSPQSPANNATGPNSIVGIVGNSLPDELAGPIIQQVSAMAKLDPNAPINDPQTMARVTAVTQAAIARAQGRQPQPQVAQTAPQGFQPSPQQLAAQNDPELKRLRYLAASPDKSTAEAARAELKGMLESRQPTNDMKQAAASGLTLQQYQERQGELASQQAGATERAKADVKEQQTYIDSGKAASQRLTTLNTLSNILSSDKNLTLGFGGETALKAKMALQQLGINVGDLSGAEAIQKLNAGLASEMTKALASRPTQFEFKTFLANNPGLLLDKAGNDRLIGIFSQLAKREIDIGKLARKNQDNWGNWDNVVENYDKSHPMTDPVTRKPITTDSIVAPSKVAAPAGSAQAATLISSKADYDKLPSGAKFTGPDGKPWQKP